MTFSAEFYDTAGSPWLPPAGISVAVERISATATGGCEDARIRVTGPAVSLREFLRVLRFEVRIRNDIGRLVWWGFVFETSVTVDGATDTLSLDDMYNSVRVLYAHEDEDGAPQDAETTAATNAESIARYGIKEMLYSAGDADATSAEKLRDKYLALHAWPLSPAEGASEGDEDEAVIECRGWWEMLRWEYYADTSGREIFEAQKGSQIVGWRIQSTEVGFTSADKAIYHNGLAFRALNTKDKITISGSSSNDGTYTIEDSADGSKQTEYTATTIRFQADEEIFDTEDGAGGFGFVEKNDFIKIGGTASGLNDRFWRLNEVDANHMVTQKWWGYNLATQGKGPSITITRLLKMRLAEAVNNGYPGPLTTITVPGQKVYMKWAPSVGTWACGEISLRVWKEGTPGDNLKVELCANSVGFPGTVLADATLAGANVGKQAGWKKFVLSTPVTVTAGTNYHIVLSRTGSSDSNHYYMTAVDEDLGYSGGSMGLWDGSSWIARAVDADMPFQAWGTRENATQINAMLLSCGFVTGAEVVTTGIVTRHYRDGRSTAQDEVLRLIEQGTSTGGGLVARVTPARTVQVEVEPAHDPATSLLVAGQQIYYADGTRCEPGYLPAGQWVRRRDLPSSESYARLSPLFLQRVEYDVKNDKWRWTRRGVTDVFGQWSARQ